MQLACTIEYLDTADPLGTVEGVLILSESQPAKGTIYVWLVSDDAPDGKPEQYDLIENAITDGETDGTFMIRADSMRAEGSFGEGNSKVALRVTPK